MAHSIPEEKKYFNREWMKKDVVFKKTQNPGFWLKAGRFFSVRTMAACTKKTQNCYQYAKSKVSSDVE